MRAFLFATIALFGLCGCAQKAPLPLATVEHVDIDRYAGKWIEIARYENRFEKGCFGATATYQRENETLNVLNQCYAQTGELLDKASGRAYTTDTSNAKLKVTFFWPFYGDYHIIMLADDYRFSVVGEPSRKYLWILSRTNHLSEADKTSILQQLPQYGYEPSKLYWTTVQP